MMNVIEMLYTNYIKRSFCLKDNIYIRLLHVSGFLVRSRLPYNDLKLLDLPTNMVCTQVNK